MELRNELPFDGPERSPYQVVYAHGFTQEQLFAFHDALKQLHGPRPMPVIHPVAQKGPETLAAHLGWTPNASTELLPNHSFQDILDTGAFRYLQGEPT